MRSNVGSMVGPRETIKEAWLLSAYPLNPESSLASQTFHSAKSSGNETAQREA